MLDEHGSDPHEQVDAAVGVAAESDEHELQEGQDVVLLEPGDGAEDDLLLADVQDLLEQVPVLGVDGLHATNEMNCEATAPYTCGMPATQAGEGRTWARAEASEVALGAT